MMQLKFRAYDKLTKQICSVVAINWKNWDIDPSILNYVTIELDGNVDRLENEIELMQFTGLLDKEGEEIYEGDVLLRLNGTIGYVLFINGAFSFSHDKMPLIDFELYDKGSEWAKIIGNIYEHPHLLKDSI